MTMPGRGDPQPSHDPYDITGAPTPPGGTTAVPSGTVSPVPTAFPDQYTEPVSPTGAWEPTPGAVGPDLPSGGPTAAAPAAARKHSRAGAAWVALVVAAIVMIFLLIFIVQNSDPVQVRYFGFEGTLPLGVAMLFAAIAGALTAGLLGTVRILQLRARARRAAAR